ncbi:MAG: O-antigen ligase family protein [Ignavibacteria bacterium]|nr:O-antigen ligase family protein [Ignavibacteria bacterium]
MIDNPDLFESFIKALIYSGSLFAIVGLLMFYGGFHPLPVYDYALISVINHPNNTSIIFTICFLPNLFYIYWKYREFSLFEKVMYISLFVIQLAAQLLTLTRAGMLATLAGLLLFFGFIYRRKAIFLLPIIIISSLTFGVAFFEAKGFASFVSRFYLLIPAFNMIFKDTKSTLWGYGLNNSLKEYKKELVNFSPSEFMINDPHNSYVTLALMFGLLITFIILFFIGYLIVHNVRNIFSFNHRALILFHVFLVSSSVSLFVQGIFDAELVKYDFYTIHYLLTILGFMYINCDHNYPGKLIRMLND